MPGAVLEVIVTVGQTVSPGDVLLRVEAMKMENEIKSPTAGVVKSIAVREGQAVESGERLVLGHVVTEDGGIDFPPGNVINATRRFKH